MPKTKSNHTHQRKWDQNVKDKVEKKPQQILCSNKKQGKSLVRIFLEEHDCSQQASELVDVDFSVAEKSS